MQDVDARKQKLDKEVDQPALSDTEKLRGRHETAQPQTADDAPSSTALNLLVNMLWEVSVLTSAACGQADEHALVRRQGCIRRGLSQRERKIRYGLLNDTRWMEYILPTCGADRA